MTEATCAVIGGGPAGLMAAEVLADAGHRVTVYDRMPNMARKFLMAGIGGLNLSHSEQFDEFLSRYRGLDLSDQIDGFKPDDLRSWCEGLGQSTFVGSSGRIFPTAFKASPLLRAWLSRLDRLGVKMKPRHRWVGWRDDALLFETPEGDVEHSADVTILALGGASWPRLGSDGTWPALLDAKIAPLVPSNCGFGVDWSSHISPRFAGEPLKGIALSFAGRTVRGEAMVTEKGIEGGAIYALSFDLRDAIYRDGHADITVDLKPDLNADQIVARLSKSRRGDTLSSRLRKALRLSPVAVALLRETPLPSENSDIARRIKAVPLRLNRVFGIERAISSGGGVEAGALDRNLMLRTRPGTFVAGEMLDWEAPTGGYLIQGCLATGRWAAKGAVDWFASRR